MDNFLQLEQQIKRAEKIAVLTHINPDGDTLGCALALKILIKNNLNKDVDVIRLNEIPQIYNFLPEINTTFYINDIDINQKYNLVIAVDVAAIDRLGKSITIFENAQVSINIDHHVTNNGFAAINFISKDVCSAGHLLFNIAKNLNWQINKDIATCLYTSILTDTGNFKYENTSYSVLEMATDLIKKGVQPSVISNFCYETKHKNMVLLSAYSVNKSVFEFNDKVAYTILQEDDLKKFNAKQDYTEGIVEILRQISTVEIAILLKELSPSLTKASLRSRNIDLTPIVEKFGGGGHKFAAGCTINRPASIAIEKLLEEIQKTNL